MGPVDCPAAEDAKASISAVNEADAPTRLRTPFIRIAAISALRYESDKPLLC
jgi:hypothetical protein